MLEVRTATRDDLPTLTAAWYEAAFWQPDLRGERPSVADALRMPEVARYRWDPDRDGDVAVVARIGTTGVGGAWARHFPADDPGYGFVDEATPELGIGVVPDHRGRGIGRALLATLLVEAAAAGHEQLSLSVQWHNPSRYLYLQLGFTDVTIEDDAFTMMRPTTARTHIP